MMGFQPVVFDPDNPLGNRLALYEGRSMDKRVLKVKGGRAGAVTSLLLYMIEKDIVDAVVVAKKERGLKGRTVVARTPGEILGAAGSRWSVVPYTLGLKEILSSPDIERVAVVGLPCQAQFLFQIKLFPLLESDFGEKIHLIISLFCMGTFAIESFLDFLRRAYGLRAEEIESIEVRGERLVVRHDGGKLAIEISKALTHLQHGCLTCPDYTGLFSDLSAGRSKDPNYSFLIVRTERALKLLEEASEGGYISLKEPSEETIRYFEEKAREKLLRSQKYLSKII